jgi:hypothetical protein
VSELFGTFATPDTLAQTPGAVLVRLVVALLLGSLVALIYRRTRAEPASTFTTTLVLLAVLIAMVTQIIGDNVARAFSLVGALSIVRFRTVVRDTQDTAYVIFSVAVGMAVGASSLLVAAAGMAVFATAAFAMRTRRPAAMAALPFRLTVRLGLGREAQTLLPPVLDLHVTSRQLVEVKTARVGAGSEVAYRVAFASDDSGHALVSALTRTDGVTGASLERVEADES